MTTYWKQADVEHALAELCRRYNVINPRGRHHADKLRLKVSIFELDRNWDVDVWVIGSANKLEALRVNVERLRTAMPRIDPRQFRRCLH